MLLSMMMMMTLLTAGATADPSTAEPTTVEPAATPIAGHYTTPASDDDGSGPSEWQELLFPILGSILVAMMPLCAICMDRFPRRDATPKDDDDSINNIDSDSMTAVQQEDEEEGGLVVSSVDLLRPIVPLTIGGPGGQEFDDGPHPSGIKSITIGSVDGGIHWIEFVYRDEDDDADSHPYAHGNDNGKSTAQMKQLILDEHDYVISVEVCDGIIQTEQHPRGLHVITYVRFKTFQGKKITSGKYVHARVHKFVAADATTTTASPAAAADVNTTTTTTTTTNNRNSQQMICGISGHASSFIHSIGDFYWQDASAPAVPHADDEIVDV
jgi:Jacalin-like lectin domain